MKSAKQKKGMHINELLIDASGLPWSVRVRKGVITIVTGGKEVTVGNMALADALYLCHAANTLQDAVHALGILLKDQQRPKSELSNGQFKYCQNAYENASTVRLHRAFKTWPRT